MDFVVIGMLEHPAGPKYTISVDVFHSMLKEKQNIHTSATLINSKVKPQECFNC